MNLTDLAHDELRKELEDPKLHSESQDAREFKETIGALLPWHRLWAATLVTPPPSGDLAGSITEAKKQSAEAETTRYREESTVSNEITRVYFDTLLSSERGDVALVGVFNQWVARLKRPLFTTTLTDLARLAARSPGLEAHALEYASEALRQIGDAREDAESQSDSYVQLARAVLVISSDEALAYFNQAVEVASKIGDENLDRWRALLDLADRAASRDERDPVEAYRLSRCAELTYHYVARDKHFDWQATTEAITGLCGNSSLAILSRWRDRGFGSAERILPIAVNFLVARGDLDPKIALALVGFRAHWDEPLMLKRVLTASTNKTEKKTATEFAYHYMTLDQQSASRWRGLKNVLTEHGLVPPELEERITFYEREERSIRSTTEHAAREDKDGGDWSAVFEGIDASVANDISRAYRSFKNFEPPYYHKRFFKELCRQVKVGKESEFITAIADVTDFGLYDLRSFLEQLPESWKSRVAVKPALAQTIQAFCRRFCMEITAGQRYYDPLPLKTACELSGVPEAGVVDVVLRAVGEAPEVAGAGRLFSLTGLLAPKLTENEAREALSFGLDLLETVLEVTDGDGSWSPSLEPPGELEHSVAGYVWGGLAAPRASLRWESAHVVRALCALGCSGVLSHLVSLASGQSAHAFFDPRLQPYELHARQWLLIGLARAAKDHPGLVAPHADFFTKLAFAGEPHVLIREFSKRTIVALMDAGYLGSRRDLHTSLANVNVSAFVPRESKSYRYVEDETTDTKDKTVSDDEDRFYFGIDIGPYWFAPLGECFGRSQTSIEREALLVIKRDWQLLGGNRWDEDQRLRRQVFRDMETYHSHGSYPRVDELRFYLSYHAMMVVAGKLLATTPVHRDPDYPEDRFPVWLKRHDLSRRDGDWLADRRDPTPLERPNWKDEKEIEEWRWSITRSDFDRALIARDDRLNLWGNWTWISGQQEESIRVASALVSPDHSMALLRALQSVDNPHTYRIPDAVDDLQIDFEGFQLKGWIVDRSDSSGLDGQDPWAGDIRHPTPEPAGYIIDLMSLYSDDEHRQYFVRGDHVNVASCHVWGRFREKDDDETGSESGTRFQASRSFVVSLLEKLHMDLIIEVEIDRRRKYYRWERKNDNEIGFIPPSARLFLLRSDGSLITM